MKPTKILSSLFLLAALVLVPATRGWAVISGVHVISQTPNSVTLGWNDSIQAASPSVSYTASVNCGSYTNQYTGPGICSLTNTITITGLSAGTSYCFLTYDYVCYAGYWQTGPTIVVTTGGTYTPTETGTISPTFTVSPTDTPTFTVSPTDTPTFSVSPTSTSSASPTSTATPTFTKSFTASPTASPTSTATPTFTETWTRTSTITETSSATPTFTKTFTQTSTASPTQTSSASPTQTSSASPTVTKSATPTNTPNYTATPTWTASASPTSTETSTATPVISTEIYGVAQERFSVTATGSAQTVTFNTAKLLGGQMPLQNAYAIDTTSPASYAQGYGTASIILQSDSSAFEAGLSTVSLVLYRSGAQQITLYIPNGMLTNTHVYAVVISYLTLN